MSKRKKRGRPSRGRPPAQGRAGAASAPDAARGAGAPPPARPAARRGAGDGPGPRRRRVWVLALLALIVAGGGVAAWLLARGRGRPASPPAALAPLPAPHATPPARPVKYSDFVGAQTCAECHPKEYAEWKASTHGRAGGPPTPGRVLPRFNGTPIHFKDATVRPVVRGGVYEFLIDQPGLPQKVLRVDGVVGGGHMVGGGTQGFLHRAVDGTLRFIPFDWSKGLGAWFCNTQGRANDGYVPITDTLSITACVDWPLNRSFGTTARFSDCEQCHGSEIYVTWDAAAHRYDTRIRSLAVDCESCHGPGRRHVELARSGRMAGLKDIGMKDLETLPKDSSIAVCMRCHALKQAIAPGGYLPGRPLRRYYALKYPMLGTSPYYVDGRVRTFAYQATQLYSDCYLNGSMTCVDCHDPHSQTYRNTWGQALKSRFSNGQCLDCHPSEEPVEAHTHHPAGSVGSLCVSCHMPYIQQPELGDRVPYGRSDHTIPIPRPGFDDSMGVTNACARCHKDRTTAQLRATVARWWGRLKPHKTIITDILAADTVHDMDRAARLLLRPGAAFPMAQFDGLSRFLVRYITPDMPPLGEDVARRLRALAASPDLDVRSLALATLHLARGEDPATRALLIHALRDDRVAGDSALRRRWTAALGYLGDTWAGQGHTAEAVRAFTKALQVLPGDPRLLLHLGLAYAQGGELQPAIQAFQSSLRTDSLQPLVMVNLGNALEAVGQSGEAATIYRRALQINPYESLADFDLANIFLRSKQPDRAVPLYQRALQLDPSLSPASFYLARALIVLGRYQEALQAVRQGLQFAPGDTTGLAMQRDLVHALGSSGTSP